ncbi:MAG: hypothetical protein HY903_00910 [Deltaproteobacteria bacterium]|nr:hypothetical protein [Deltaproteobacteria bacterium]
MSTLAPAALVVSLLLAAVTTHAAAAEPAPVAVAPPPPASIATAPTPAQPTWQDRITLAGLYAFDNNTGRDVGFADLHVFAEAGELTSLPVGAVIDGRARHFTAPSVDDRLTLVEGNVRLGRARDPWRLTLGRQLVRPLANTEVDGLKLDRQLTESTSLFVFGGLAPHPQTGAFDNELAIAGLGIDSRGEGANQSGGAVASTFGGKLDRAYLNHRAFLSFGREWTFSTFTVVDLVAPQPLVRYGTNAKVDGGLDLTSFNALARIRPARWWDSSLVLSHNHTVLPNRWWSDYLAAERKKRGFIIDGEEPLGTRLSSARFTQTLHVGAELAPYARLRYDRRHAEKLDGGEARAGLKWRPRWGYTDLAYAYRDTFGVPTHLGEAMVGVDETTWGIETGVTALYGRRVREPRPAAAFNVYGSLWLGLGPLADNLKTVHLLGEYQGFIDRGALFHTFFVQVAHRI